MAAIKPDRRTWASPRLQGDGSMGVKKRQKPSYKGEGEENQTAAKCSKPEVNKNTQALD